jgi:hypothetical protein
MRYMPEFDEYSETNKFLDELFEEDCTFGWECEAPQASTNNALNITVVKKEGEAEKTYLASLAEEIGEKLCEIIDKFDNVSDEKTSCYGGKSEIISRVISISNSLDGILSDIESSSTASNLNNTIAVIGGAAPAMF